MARIQRWTKSFGFFDPQLVADRRLPLCPHRVPFARITAESNVAIDGDRRELPMDGLNLIDLWQFGEMYRPRVNFHGRQFLTDDKETVSKRCLNATDWQFLPVNCLVRETVQTVSDTVSLQKD